MDFRELKKRAEQLWKEQYTEVVEMRNSFGYHDNGTERAYSKLFDIEETIIQLTGNMINESEFDKWAIECRKEV